MDNFVESFYPTKFDKVFMVTLSRYCAGYCAGR